jgi:NADP-dependent 3-hydroxy acid dehydrogenase YdfG
MRSRFEGHVAAVTGAASGIGRHLALELVRRGASVALADVDDAALAETVSLCEGRGVKVTSATVDVADRGAVHAWAERVVEEHGAVHFVFNNAGVALGATVDAMSYDDLNWLMGINFGGVVHGTKAFLPFLLAQDEGHIVNISSVFGLISVPSQSAYNASKFAVRGFTDALRMELEISGSRVSVTTVHPGGVKTNIVRHARMDPSVDEFAGTASERDFDKIALTTPARAARVILRAVERNRRRVLVGPDAKVIDVLSRLPASMSQGLLIAGGRRRRKKTGEERP